MNRLITRLARHKSRSLVAQVFEQPLFSSLRLKHFMLLIIPAFVFVQIFRPKKGMDIVQFDKAFQEGRLGEIKEVNLQKIKMDVTILRAELKSQLNGKSLVTHVSIEHPNAFYERIAEKYPDCTASYKEVENILTLENLRNLSTLFVVLMLVRSKFFGGSTKQAANRVTQIPIRFKDVVGVQKSKQQITQFVEFLKSPRKFHSIGAKLPKGALMTGPPGTGKTLLAKACAGQAGVPFYYSSGSQFVQLFAGKGAERVRELFKNAKSTSPSIIFIDQIDAIGAKRRNLGGGHNQTQNTLNQLLVEMDGFLTDQNVIVIGATNRPQVLDPALTRPGRFDRKIQIPLPSIAERKQIIKVYLSKIKVAESINEQKYSQKLAGLTPGFSGADIANICNEAAILAGRRKAQSVQDQDFQKAVERVTSGIDKKRILTKQDKQLLAYNQVGKAVVSWFSEGGDPIHKLRLLANSKGSASSSQYLKLERTFYSKEVIMDKITIMLSGRMAVHLFLKKLSQIEKNDILRATELANDFITKFGMSSELFNLSLNQENYKKEHSDRTSQQIDQQSLKIIAEATQRSKAILQRQESKVIQLANLLLQRQRLEKADIEAVLGEPLWKKSADEMATKLQ